MAENPRKKSVINIHRMGSRKTNFLLLNLCDANNAIAPIGVKLGGWGSSLVTIAKTINENITKFLFMVVFLLIKNKTKIKY